MACVLKVGSIWCKAQHFGWPVVPGNLCSETLYALNKQMSQNMSIFILLYIHVAVQPSGKDWRGNASSLRDLMLLIVFSAVQELWNTVLYLWHTCLFLLNWTLKYLQSCLPGSFQSWIFYPILKSSVDQTGLNNYNNCIANNRWLAFHLEVFPWELVIVNLLS